MYSRFFSLLGGLAAVMTVSGGLAVSDVQAASRDDVFFGSVAGAWSGPGEIVAGKYKGTKFTCDLTGEPISDKETGIKLGGTCRVGVFKQPMSAIIAKKGNSYEGKFLDGSEGKGLDIVSGQVSGDKVVVGINRAKLSGAMVARVTNNASMNITISVKVADQMVPVIGLTLARNIDQMPVGSIKQ
ncbi:hypothetical protein GGQ73_003825 [Rhizobium skierniewicense]|uniref:Uncharacterized protein n=1 Tax=Rhizobium skierniewicense TaxID=984260 RepID=A0A7W6CDF5_9HYPH|nr:hypothetical protein [Rhizobium skierniewicense]MBB3947852.1 hypothetical protein [Rhizobium skierniewicense]